MRYEGGRYRFTTEPNLNKVIVEREGAIGDDRIVDLLREAIVKAVSQGTPFRVETGVTESSDLVDEPRLTLGLLGFDLTIGPERAADVQARAQAILTSRGASARSNKNAVALVAADQNGMLKARQTARTLAALRDISNDQTRLKRFNQEQRDQLDERRTAAEERLPQQLTMAYRHLILLSSGEGNGATRLDNIDLGPARVTDTIPGRVAEYLRGSDRLLDTVLAPAALLSARFGVMAPDAEAIEIDKLLGYFYRLPRLPKIATADVLRNCLVQGVENGTFGLASGSAWEAGDTVLRFQSQVSPGEIQFQPGTWLLRASTAKRLKEERAPATPATAEAGETKAGEPGGESISDGSKTPSDEMTATTNPTRITISIREVPADKIRDVLKVAVFPLISGGATVTTTVEIAAQAASGIPRNTLDMVVLEGLRQLGIEYRLE
jgi:hypothetical protein